MCESIKEQYDESLLLLLSRIGELEEERKENIHNPVIRIDLDVRIGKLKDMLEDVYVQYNNARDYHWFM